MVKHDQGRRHHALACTPGPARLRSRPSWDLPASGSSPGSGTRQARSRVMNWRGEVVQHAGVPTRRMRKDGYPMHKPNGVLDELLDDKSLDASRINVKLVVRK